MVELTMSIIGGAALLIALLSIKIVNQYERGVKFTLGKYTGIMTPGLNFVVPVIQSYERLDMRQTTIDLKPQEVMTKDNVNLKIDGVVFYVPDKPDQIVLNVENIRTQLEAKATSELKEIVGNMDMTEGLTKRDEIANKLLDRLNKAIQDEGTGKSWGVIIKAVQINNIELPKDLVRAMAKVAEAEREKQARIMKATGEQEAAQKFKEASEVFEKHPSAMRLRELQTYQEIGVEQNSLMLVIPSEMATNPAALAALAATQKK